MLLEAALRRQGISQSEALQDILGPDYQKSTSVVPSTTTGDAQPLTPASVGTENLRSMTTTQLVRKADTGQFRFVDNSLWSRVVEEIHDFDQAREEKSTSEEDYEEDSEDDCAFVLGTVPTNLSNPLPHPDPERLVQLWQIFVDNVDPLTKVVHVHTIEPAIIKASRDVNSVPKAFEALLFAIYTAAVMSLKDTDCRRQLGQSRKSLLGVYSSATRTALSRVRFMNTSNIVVLQALVLYLMAVREIYEPRLIWVLTGVAIRIAEGMGLQCDGTSLGLPPFETEIRRRIWWQVKMHDFRTAELAGVKKFQGMSAGINPPKTLTNMNDDEFHPGMTIPLVDSNEPTDMVFCVLRSELGNFAAAHAQKFMVNNGNIGLWNDYIPARDAEEKDAAVQSLKEIFDLKYLRYCDPSQPLQLMTLLFARSAIHVGHFVSHHPRRWVTLEAIPQSEQDYVWDLSIKLLNIHDMMQSDRRLKGFSWYASYYTQWHAFIHVLDTLRAKPTMKGADHAWQLVEATYENNPTWISNIKRPIYVAVGNLCLKAFIAREAALAKDGGNPPAAPHFIMELRHHREAAKSKRGSNDRKRSNPGPNVVHEPPNLENAIPTVNANDTSHAQPPVTQQHPSLQPNYQLEQVNEMANDSDTFWYGGGHEDRMPTHFDDPTMMMMSMDYIFAPDQDYQDPNNAGQGVNWSQWDAWLADSGMTLPNASFGMDFNGTD
ncbi:hypothetical protein LTR84_012162 [Exophiala bonariae]|uniref:Xylanolytic transcriptional activator regulatory domain-containing protein n=1 Tax=Exophiala bonariae TaxID=1690606 RepID=A0AAV9NI02_9EURO|nr:hypothetical protein LTR84_012162 [Exophiala bonariae]